jgi:sigma-B regulation protein RsbU (phosphoserine phosphatase)
MTRVRVTLAVKFAALFGVFAVAAGALVCSITYGSYRRSMLEHYGRYAAGAANLAVSVLPPDELLRYAHTLSRDARYFSIERELDRIRTSLGVKYLYVQMPVSDTEYMYLFDVYDLGEEEGEDTFLGARGGYGDDFEMAKLAMRTGNPVHELEITNTEYGYLASAYAPIKGADGSPFAYVGVDISMDYIRGFLTRYLGVIALATVLVMVMSFSALFFLIRHAVVNPIRAVAGKTGEFTRRVGDENFEDMPVSSNDEIGDLTASVNAMFGEIRDFTRRLSDETTRRERIQSELDTARAIQDSVLPKIFPPFRDYPNAEIFAGMTPAKEVGGDFYDFFIVGKNKLAVVIADVSGKSVPAALFMMVTRTLIKNRALSEDEPHELLEAVNNQLCQNNETAMFVTAFVGILDAGQSVLRYANAGHNPPLLLRTGRAGWLPVTPGLALGALENVRFVTQEAEFKNNDVLLLYTDGVTEAMNSIGELYGEDRLFEFMSGIAGKDIGVRNVVEAVNSAVRIFADGAEQSDDITVLALRKTG